MYNAHDFQKITCQKLCKQTNIKKLERTKLIDISESLKKGNLLADSRIWSVTAKQRSIIIGKFEIVEAKSKAGTKKNLSPWDKRHTVNPATGKSGQLKRSTKRLVKKGHLSKYYRLS